MNSFDWQNVAECARQRTCLHFFDTDNRADSESEAYWLLSELAGMVRFNEILAEHSQ
jgi:hypothetical protein